MISILYRLTSLSFPHDALQEALRLGLLAISSTLFMQRQYMDNPYHHLLNLYRSSLLRLWESASVAVPTPILFWLAMLSHVAAPSLIDWSAGWLDESIRRADIKSWTQARELLRSLVWVDFIHDRLGKPAFETAML